MEYVGLVVFVAGVVLYVLYSYRKMGRARSSASDDTSKLPPSGQSLENALRQVADSPGKGGAYIVRHDDGSYSVLPPGVLPPDQR